MNQWYVLMIGPVVPCVGGRGGSSADHLDAGGRERGRGLLQTGSRGPGENWRCRSYIHQLHNAQPKLKLAVVLKIYCL